jgi:uncharacterized RmlC-like cupin family protein
MSTCHGAPARPPRPVRRAAAGLLVLALAALAPAWGDQPVDAERLTPADIAARIEQAAQARGPHGPAVATAALVGDPSRPGLYTVRVSIPAHTRVRPHTHRDNRSVVVVSGTWRVGYGRRFEESALKALPPGSVYTEPAGEPHFSEAADVPVVILVTGYGPSDTRFVGAGPT